MILMYHKVDIVVPSEWWVSIEQFERQLRALLDQGKQFVYLDDYVIGSETQVAVTFDDAYENNCRHAAPILRRLGIPFEVFVIGNMLGKWNQFDKSEMLTRFCRLGQLARIVKLGGRLQWHSRSHRVLTKLTDEQLEQELDVNPGLRDHFPEPHFRWFAYPYGEHNDRILNAVKDRFRGALSVDFGDSTDRHQLNRVTVDEIWLPK